MAYNVSYALVPSAYSAKWGVYLTMPGKSRFRLRYTFWLDQSRAEDREAAELVEQLKERRGFARAVRNGIRLIADLEAGRVDTLLALFPWIADAIARRNPPADDGDLRAQIEQLKHILLQQGGIAAPPPGYPTMKSTAQPPPTIQVQAAAPVDPSVIVDNFLAFIQ